MNSDNDIFEQPISYHVWDSKYRYSQNSKQETSVEQTWQRVAVAIAQPERNSLEREYWRKRFFEILENFLFLPGGRILAGAGVNKELTLFNCFVMLIREDSLSAIFDGLKEGALTLQQGGGVGYDFSILRPKGYACKRTHSIASGPVSFMRIWDSMSATMISSASRRGAMMANLRCDHPDIEEFITIKSDPKELRQFNLSVIITNEFMSAVVNNEEWALVFPTDSTHTQNLIYRRWSGSPLPVPCEIIRTVKARDLWDKILCAAYSYAEPGVIFEDTINDYNPLWYCEWINATNPCGEIPLPPYAACNLGSINLTKFVRDPFTAKASIKWQELERTIEVATRFLDNAIDASNYPLGLQKQAAHNTRRIGLGFSGLANIFVMLGITYGSTESLKLAKEIAEKIAISTWQTSAKLAVEKGSFTYFEKENYLGGKFVQSLPHDVIATIEKYGMRNSHHNAIAPTGSISLYANNISGGIEPIFSPGYKRKVRGVNGEILNFTVEDYAYRHWKEISKRSELPPAWVDINHLQPIDHLNIQGAIQPFVDNAISKTINLPEDFPFEKLTDIYRLAYDMKLKGCTIFRPNEVTGSILSQEEDPSCSICSK